MQACERALMAHAAGSAGLFTAADARAHGLDEHWLHRAHRSGLVERVHSRTYRISGAPPGSAVDLAAIQASSGRELFVSHGSAAALQGFPGLALAQPYEVVVRGTTAISRDGCVVHRTRVLEPRDIGEAGGLPSTSRERTLVDVAGRVDVVAAMSLVDFLVCSSKAGERQRLHRVALPFRGSRRHAALVVRLTSPGAGAWFRSWLEREARALYAAGGLPPCEWNVIQRTATGRRIGEVDCRWPDGMRPVIAELEGLRFHTTPAQRRRDAERFNALGDVSIVKRFTWEDVVTRPNYVLQTVATALQAVHYPGLQAMRPIALSTLSRSSQGSRQRSGER